LKKKKDKRKRRQKGKIPISQKIIISRKTTKSLKISRRKRENKYPHEKLDKIIQTELARFYLG
jgi:hypothetical protein